MNNKEFIAQLAETMQMSVKETQKAVDAVIGIMTGELQDGNTISLQGFGTFDVKKKNERVVMNPLTKQKMLTPPKLVLGFKPSNVLKDKINSSL